MAFKLGSEKRGFPSKKNHFEKDDASVPGTPVIRRIRMHEMKHLVDMKTGKLSYTDDDITWMGETYKRDKGHINYNGKWLPEGSREFPWEQH